MSPVKRFYHHSPLTFCYCIAEPENIMIKNNIPGPGTYGPQLCINKIGKYVLSTVP